MCHQGAGAEGFLKVNWRVRWSPLSLTYRTSPAGPIIDRSWSHARLLRIPLSPGISSPRLCPDVFWCSLSSDFIQVWLFQRARPSHDFIWVPWECAWLQRGAAFGGIKARRSSCQTGQAADMWRSFLRRMVREDFITLRLKLRGGTFEDVVGWPGRAA